MKTSVYFFVSLLSVESIILQEKREAYPKASELFSLSRLLVLAS